MVGRAGGSSACSDDLNLTNRRGTDPYARWCGRGSRQDYLTAPLSRFHTPPSHHLAPTHPQAPSLSRMLPSAIPGHPHVRSPITPPTSGAVIPSPAATMHQDPCFGPWKATSLRSPETACSHPLALILSPNHAHRSVDGLLGRDNPAEDRRYWHLVRQLLPWR